MTILRFNITSG